MSVKITDLGPVTLPLVGTEQFEVAISETESRRLSVTDLLAAVGGLDATFVTVTANPNLPNERILTAGANVDIADGGAGNPITVSLPAALTGISVNGVTLSNAGVATNFLDETGNYSVPAGFNPADPQTITGQWQFNLAVRLRNASAAADVPGIGQIFVTGGNDIIFRSDGGVETSLLGGGGGTPGGALTSVQFNDGGAFGGFGTWDGQELEIAVDDATIIIDDVNGFGNPLFRMTSTGAGAGGAQLFLDVGTGRLAIQQTSTGGTIEDIWINMQRNGAVQLYFNNVQQFVTSADGVRLPNSGGQSLYFDEKAAANADVAGQGQVWVRNDAPNTLMFTDDAGTDFVIGGALLSFLQASDNAVITGSWEFTNVGGLELGPSCELDMRNNADNSTTFIQNNGPDLEFGIAGADFGSGVVQFLTTSWLRIEVPNVFIAEAAAAVADVAGFGQFWVLNTTPNEPMFTRDDGVDIALAQDLYNNATLQAQATLLGLDVRDTLRVGTLGSTTGVLKLGEQANADVDEAGYGQHWVRDDVPNNPMFTDDAGNDFEVGFARGRVVNNSSFNFNTAENTAYNRVLFYDDGSNNTITLEDSGSQVNWPVGTAVQVIAPGSGSQTLTEGSGTTLFLEDGTDTVGGGTVSAGAGTIYRASATVYIYIGSGFTT